MWNLSGLNIEPETSPIGFIPKRRTSLTSIPSSDLSCAEAIIGNHKSKKRHTNFFIKHPGIQLVIIVINLINSRQKSNVI